MLATAAGLTMTCALPANADTAPPLPSPVYATTALQSIPVEQIAADACNTLIPTEDAPDETPWHLSRLNMEETWKLATGKGVKIAVIDTGIQVNGSEYTPTRRFSAYNVLPPLQNANPSDKWECLHGTFVASLAAAQSVDGPTQFSGIAPDAQIIGVRALYGTSAQELDGVIAAVRAAIAMHVDVINISQAANLNRGEYADAIKAALDAGIIVVAAAGNANDMGGAPLAYPAAYPGVISVGMTDAADVASPNSMSMPGRVSVAAPGVDLTGLAPSATATGQVYAYGQTGTSYAAPIVSGLAALLIQHARDTGVKLTPADVKQILEQSADPPAGPVPDDQLGHGIVNPVRALAGVAPVHNDHVPSPTNTAAPDDRPPPPRRSKAALQAALVVAALTFAGVIIGVGLKVALPAARKRAGQPAEKD
ncbi:hypothetical protein HMPREF1531_01063 [Propionibacterium sp. oral taxon 192 str. F0372]|nr:hypothetical protein HMPREF1531_01063 [Propionibacterium sp. oral taxon 192 str. F0372]